MYNTYPNTRRYYGNMINTPYNTYNTTNNSDDRFFLAPFLVGGLAGTALGYGIANNNQINRPPIFYGPVYQPPFITNYNYPMQYPTNYSTSNNFYY